MELEAYLNGGFQPQRYRPGGIGNWSGHLPFAADLIAAAKPSLFVELGTHYGESYFGFCQAVRENDVACSCYAVDTWLGEAHAGFYDESVFRDVDGYNSAHYADFSYLLRTTFDEAIAKFAEGSIDILHIDGLHTYQAVSHDLQSWLSKVKPGGIVLMHDVMGRHGDFGVWKVWDELASTGKHFIFRHNWGLGVFRKSGSALPDNGLFKILFDSPAQTQEHARKFYALCAIKLEHEHERASVLHSPESEIAAHVYPYGNTGHAAETAIKVDVRPGRWEHLVVDLPQGLGNGPLRVDPAEQPGLIDVSGIVIRRPANGEVLWSANGSEALSVLSAGGTLMTVNDTQQSDVCGFFSFGPDPQLILPVLDSRRFDQPLVLEIWLRVQTDMASLLPLLRQTEEQRARMRTLESERGATVTELNTLRQEREMLARDQEAHVATVRRIRSELYVCKTDLKIKITEEDRLRSELATVQQKLATVQQKLATQERVLHEAFTSRSWRITRPIRKLSEMLGAQRR